MSHNPRNPKGVIQQVNVVADLRVMGAGVDVINNNVVGALKRSTFYINKRAHRLKAGKVNAIQCLQGSGSRNLHEYRRDHRNVRQFGDDVADFHRHGRASHANKIG